MRPSHLGLLSRSGRPFPRNPGRSFPCAEQFPSRYGLSVCNCRDRGDLRTRLERKKRPIQTRYTTSAKIVSVPTWLAPICSVSIHFSVCPRNYESVREECHLKNCRWVGVAIPWAGELIHSYFIKLDGRSGSKTEVPGFARLSSSGSCCYELAIGTRLRRPESFPTLNACMS